MSIPKFLLIFQDQNFFFTEVLFFMRFFLNSTNLNTGMVYIHFIILLFIHFINIRILLL